MNVAVGVVHDERLLALQFSKSSGFAIIKETKGSRRLRTISHYGEGASLDRCNQGFRYGRPNPTVPKRLF